MAHYILFERIDNQAKVFLKDQYISHPILNEIIHNDPIIDEAHGLVPLNLPNIHSMFPMEFRIEVYNAYKGDLSNDLNPTRIKYKIIERLTGGLEISVPGITNPMEMREQNAFPQHLSWIIGYTIRYVGNHYEFEQNYIKNGDREIIG